MTRQHPVHRSRRPDHRRWLLWAGALALPALIVACATTLKRGPSFKLESALNFSHKLHAGEADCSDCHGKVAESTSGTRGAFIPKESHGGCASCHEVDDKQKCSMCHKAGAPRDIELNRVDRHLNFSHAAHAKRVKDGCKSCHPKAESATTPGVNLVGDMDACASACHQQDLRQQNCAKCHRDMQRYSLKAVGKLAHRGNFIKRHGKLARNAQNCAQCHDQTKCADCHARTAAMPLSIRFPERTEARYIHRGDFLGRHAVEARADPASCRTCHGSNHCSSCHERAGLSGAIGVTSPKLAASRVHGPDNMTPGAPGFHGRKARRDISRCASCHDQGAASNCVQCHKVGQLGGNPHPRNFRWRNKGEECRKTMCATCHVGGAGCP